MTRVRCTRIAVGVTVGLLALAFAWSAFGDPALGTTGIAYVTPPNSPSGTMVVLSGNGFVGTTGVWFGGTLQPDGSVVGGTRATDFQVGSDNTLYARVAGPSSYGIIVCSPTGCATFPLFWAGCMGCDYLDFSGMTLLAVTLHPPCAQATAATKMHKATKAQVSTAAHPCDKPPTGSSKIPVSHSIDPDTQVTWNVSGLAAPGWAQLDVQNTSADAYPITFTWVPPAGITVAKIGGSSGAICSAAKGRIQCSRTLAPSSCECTKGHLAVDFAFSGVFNPPLTGASRPGYLIVSFGHSTS